MASVHFFQALKMREYRRTAPHIDAINRYMGLHRNPSLLKLPGGGHSENFLTGVCRWSFQNHTLAYGEIDPCLRKSAKNIPLPTEIWFIMYGF